MFVILIRDLWKTGIKQKGFVCVCVCNLGPAAQTSINTGSGEGKLGREAGKY